MVGEATRLLRGNRRPYGERLVNRHEPALDGLRGLAVLGVVLFHAGFSWAVGGFLGVSTFFTLSGFLITSLLLRERRASGRIDLVAFWGRRARRLLPAALLCLVAVAALAPALATPSQLAGLRGDAWASLLYVANWRFLLDGRSYADLFSAPSPLLHFWSLAIEEQLYVLFPLVVVVVAARWLAPVLVGLVAVSVALAFVVFDGAGSSTDAAYYSTVVRGGELFVGALLAVLVTPGRRMWRPEVTRTVGVVGLVALVWAWSTVRQDEVLLYRGGFVLHAVVSAVVILAAVQPSGVVRWVLSVPPLTALGRISYGVYLYHWPVLVWWDAPLVLQLGLTLVLAVVSYVVVEQPIRTRRLTVPLAVVPAAFVVVGGVAVASTMDPPRVETFALASPSPPPLLPSDPMVEPAPDAPRVAVFGDSTALRTAFALKGWGWTTGRIDMRDGGADVGCPLARAGAVDFVVARQDPEPHCDEWPSTWGEAASAAELDAAVVQIGPWDVTERELDGSWTHIGEPAFDRLLVEEMHRAVDVLSARGALVIWLTAPRIDFGRGQAGVPRDHPINEPARIDRLNELIATVDAARDEMVVLDLAGHLRSLPGGEMDESLRPDGVHFSEEASAELVDWLGPALLALIDA